MTTTDPDYAGLIKRLQDPSYATSKDRGRVEFWNRCLEAATALAALQTDRDLQKKWCMDWEDKARNAADEIAALQARVEELEGQQERLIEILRRYRENTIEEDLTAATGMTEDERRNLG